MKKVVFNQFGETNVLEIVEASMPMPKENEVLIKVKAVSINPIDWKIRKGEMKLMSGSKFPKGIGIDFAGVVEKIGNGVSNFKVGDDIFGAFDGMKGGALSEYVSIDSKSIWHKPDSINYLQAASIPVVGSAAYMALVEIAKITEGTEVLINGATGGVGMFAIQIAKQKGAKVTSVSNTGGVQYALKWGADDALDYSKTDIKNSKKLYDVVFDLSGKLSFAEAQKIMKPSSIYINPVPKPIDIITTFFTNLFASQKNKVLLSKPTYQAVSKLIQAVNQGLLIEVGKTFRFEQVKEAYDYAEKGGYLGKVVIEIE